MCDELIYREKSSHMFLPFVSKLTVTANYYEGAAEASHRQIKLLEANATFACASFAWSTHSFARTLSN